MVLVVAVCNYLDLAFVHSPSACRIEGCTVVRYWRRRADESEYTGAPQERLRSSRNVHGDHDASIQGADDVAGFHRRSGFGGTGRDRAQGRTDRVRLAFSTLCAVLKKFFVHHIHTQEVVNTSRHFFL